MYVCKFGKIKIYIFLLLVINKWGFINLLLMENMDWIEFLGGKTIHMAS